MPFIDEVLFREFELQLKCILERLLGGDDLDAVQLDARRLCDEVSESRRPDGRVGWENNKLLMHHWESSARESPPAQVDEAVVHSGHFYSDHCLPSDKTQRQQLHRVMSRLVAFVVRCQTPVLRRNAKAGLIRELENYLSMRGYTVADSGETTSHLEALTALRDALEDWYENEAHTSTQDHEPYSPIVEGDSLHTAVVGVEAFYPGRKLPSDVLLHWYSLLDVTRGEDSARGRAEPHFAAINTWVEAEIVRLGGAQVNPSAGHGEQTEAPTGTSVRTKAKRSTERGEGRAKLIAALTMHHKYADGSCLNPAPVGVRALARLADVAESTASEFFKQHFKGYAKYQGVCRDSGRLADSLKALNGEFSPIDLYGRRPPGEDDRDED